MMRDPSRRTRSEGKTKALDALDKHMTQRSTLKKSLAANGPNVLALSESLVLNHLPSNSENVYQRSPTPRRSRESDVVMLEDKSSGLIFEEDTGEKALLSSPIRKGVSFSDRVESSPTMQTMGSSPIRPSSMTKPPARSILKHPSLHYSKHDRPSSRNSPSKASHLSIDPSSTNFWVEGEIKSMINTNNVAEFKKILKGGLHVLNVTKTRDFEIYATFNNVIPSMNGVILNDIVHQKIDVLIECLDELLDTSIYALSHLQESLLLQQKKDPFKSRCFIQVIRFLTLLFSNFKIIKFLDGNLSLQLKFIEVLKACEESLTHSNTNKVMVIYPLTLLKEEKFGQFYLPDSQIRQLVNSVFTMKYIDSTNVQCERLMVLKQFLQKYSKVMLETLRTWFPSEVAARYLMEDRVTSAKTRSCCNLIILDLLRKCISNDKVRTAIIEIESLSLKSVVENCPFGTEVDVEYTEFIKDQTLGTALCNKLISLMNDKEEYKLSMDFWLGMTGLLFNSTKNLSLLLEPVGSRWLAVNDVCFNSKKSNLRGLAIKNRRILNYMIITTITHDIDNHVLDALIQIVMRPFEFPDNEGLSEYIIFAFNSIMYLTCCDYKDMSSKRFALLFEVILKPLFQRINQPTLLPILGPQAHQILPRIIRLFSDEENSSPRRSIGFQPLKALSTIGIDLPDFEPMSNTILENNWNSIVELLKGMIAWPGFNSQNSLMMLQHCIRRSPSVIPSNQACAQSLEYLKLILEKGEIDRNEEVFKTIIRSLAEKYELHLFSNSSILLTKIFPMDQVTSAVQFEMFKNIFQLVKPFVKPLLLFGYFDRFNNDLISNYIANIVGSMLIPTNMSQQEYKSLLQIVNKMPVPEVIDNLFTWLRKTDNWGSIAGELNLSTWNDHLFANFIQKWIQEQKNSWSQETVRMLTESLWNRPAAFKELTALLINAEQTQIIKDTLEKNPDIIDDISPLGDLSLLDILPATLVKSSFSKIQQYDDVIKTKLFLCISTLDEISIIKSNTELLYQLLLPTDDDVSLNNDRNTIMDMLLKSSIGHQDWDLLSMLFEVCLLRRDSDKIVDFLTAGKIKFENIKPNTIARMINESGKLNSDLIDFLRDSFKNLNPSYVIDLMEQLLKQTKYQVFDIITEELLSFIFDIRQQLSADDKERLKGIFPAIVDYFVGSNPKILTDIMKYVVNIMKSAKEKQYGSSLIVLFLNHPDFKIQGNKTLLKKLNVFKANAKRNSTRQYKFIPPKENKKVSDRETLQHNEQQDNTNIFPLSTLSVIETKVTSSEELEVPLQTLSETSDELIRTGCQKVVEPIQNSNDNEPVKMAASVQSEKLEADTKQNAVSQVSSGEMEKQAPSIKDSSTEVNERLPGVANNDEISKNLDTVTSVNSPSGLPLKIPIFNPFFTDVIKLEEDLASKGDTYISGKRSLELMNSADDVASANCEGQHPTKKIMRIVSSLNDVDIDDVKSLSNNDKKLLRKVMYNFMLNLED